MQTITKFILALAIAFSFQQLQAQESSGSDKQAKIEILEKQKERVENEEREKLKAEIEIINRRLDRGEINQAEADRLKKEMAEKRAANIENRIAIIDNKIALLKRSDEEDALVNDDDDPGFRIQLGRKDGEDSYIYIGPKTYKPRRYDRRTTSDLVFAIGFNNALIDGQSLDDSPYKLGGSGFVELGWAWKTRLFQNSNAVRLKYGFSFMWNKLNIKDNQYLVNDNDVITLEEFPENLKKAKFRSTNLVFPLHFEFGPSRRIDRDTYFRYSTRDQFKIGIGGYAGFNIATLQKLKYEENGRNVKDKIKRGYNTSNLVYGLSAYVAFDDVALYVKYDLNPIFKDQAVEQNNISLGLRFDVD